MIKQIVQIEDLKSAIRAINNQKQTYMDDPTEDNLLTLLYLISRAAMKHL